MTAGQQGVSYISSGADYFAKRRLQRSAGVWSLWALGAGAVIWGHYSGWNVGYGAGGWGGLLIAGMLVAVMYLGLVFCIAEMSTALPHSGAAYSFARTAMGPWGGFLAGLFQNVEYVVMPAVIVFYIGSYLTTIFGTGAGFQPIWWLAGYVAFVGLNVAGAALSFRVAQVLTILALTVLVIFWVSAVPNMEFSRWALNMAADGSELPYGNGPWLPFGFESALTALPSAVWLFLAIELVPLAAEEAKDPQRDVPWAIILAMLTLLVSALLTLWLTPSVIGVGTHRLASSGEPLLDGLRAIYGETHGKTAAGIAIVGLIASFHSLLFAQGRQIYALSRAGYFPPGLSVTHALSKTPVAAMLAGAAVGLGLIAMIHWTKGEEEGAAVIGGTLLNMAVAAAMFSIVAQALSFILLRARRPDMERPYVSPFGIPGALVTIAIAVVTLIYQLSDPAYRDGVVGLLIWLGLGTVYFALVGRHRLRLAPEEEFALAQNV